MAVEGMEIRVCSECGQPVERELHGAGLWACAEHGNGITIRCAEVVRTEEYDRLRGVLLYIAENVGDEAWRDELGPCASGWHLQRHDDLDARCPDCLSKWWALDGSRPDPDSYYEVEALIRRELAK